MNIKELQAEIDALADQMSEKGMERVTVNAMIQHHEQPRVFLNHMPVGGTKYSDEEFHVARGDTMEEAIAKAREWIAAQPSARERRRGEVLRLILRAVEAAREADIEVEMINPLEAVAKALSENALPAR